MNKVVTFYYKVASKLKSRSIYPDKLEVSLTELVEKKTNKIKVAIIDNEYFPWREGLKQLGCSVKYFPDYIERTDKKGNIKVRELSNFDIIICDIHDIGVALYKDSEGIGVMRDLRKKNPFQIIVAYTGDPGTLHKSPNTMNIIDKVFCRDWSDSDFFLNFEELLKVFHVPSSRWEFLNKRLSYLNVPKNKIKLIQQHFVEKVLFFQYIKQSNVFSATQVNELILTVDNTFNYNELIKFGLPAIKLASMLGPAFSQGAE